MSPDDLPLSLPLSLVPRQFHRAGIKAHNVTLGVPRINELIDCTRNPRTPSMTLVVLPSFEAPPVLEKLRLGLVELRLCKAVTDVCFLDEPDFFASEHSALDAELAARLRLVHARAPAVFGAFVARLTLDPGLLVPRGLSPSDVASLLERHCPCHVAASEELHTEWVLRVRFTALARGAGATQHPEGSPQEALQLLNLTEELAHKLCREVLLSGLVGLQSAVLQEEALLRFCPERGCVRGSCSTLLTQGSNLAAAFALPFLDAARCTSNDVQEVLAVLGVEAATAVLFEQMQFVLQFDGSYINERHLLLLVSFMTALGGLLPVSRHGINKLVDSGPLARASFEEVADRLAESAIYADVDPVLCHSSRIMIGEACRVGTGVCELLHEPPAPESDAESDAVVFTMMDGEAVHMLEGARADATGGAPIEMPFRDDAFHVPEASEASAAGGSGNFTHVSCAGSGGRRGYAPSSPKQLLLERKRQREPSADQNSE